MKNNKKNRIERKEAVNIIKSGKFCTVKFAKRTDNSSRTMNCRTGVKKYLKGDKGNGPAYRAADHDLIPVYDLKEGQYRSIPIERILAVNGKIVI